ncbi:MAG: metallophosphoesterase [Bdellovibrionales bacterium]|nr:metallophosphoesterase [Bdellovibrionales bacterium]
MSIKKLFSFFLLLYFFSCKYTYSPYEVGTVKLHQNSINLQNIQNNETQTGNDFKVAFISDTHNYYEDLHDLINVINKRGPYSFVVVTGDITNQGLLSEYTKTKEYLNDLKCPYLVVVGNHDLLSNGGKIYRRLFGSTDFSLIYKDAEFIFFNNNNWEAGGAVPNVEAVEAKLRASTASQKILIAHVSPEDKDRFTDSEISLWQNLVTTYNVNYFINGHDHTQDINGFGTGQRVTVGAPSKRAYFELIFSATGVTHQKISF